MSLIRLMKQLYWAFIQAGQFEAWKKKNRHNYTTAGNNFDISHVTVGKKTYGTINVLLHNPNYYLKIGSYCSIAPDVMFILASDHRMDCVSTYPFKFHCVKCASFEAISKGDIIIDDDVWIGYGATIMSGVHIHQGAVIAAGALVSSDVEPYAVVGGVPAKVIKFRFSKEIIAKLLKIDFEKVDDEIIINNLDKLYSRVEEKTALDWLPLRDKL